MAGVGVDMSMGVGVGVVDVDVFGLANQPTDSRLVPVPRTLPPHPFLTVATVHDILPRGLLSRSVLLQVRPGFQGHRGGVEGRGCHQRCRSGCSTHSEQNGQYSVRCGSPLGTRAFPGVGLDSPGQHAGPT